jgi:hypothetical protein
VSSTTSGIIDVLGIDLGFGDVKVTAMSLGQILKLYKFSSAVAAITESEHFKDERAIKMGDISYYIGDLALNQPSAAIIDMTEYEHLEAYLPLFLHKVLTDLGCNPENYPKQLAIGLSVAHISQSGHFKAKADEYFKVLGWNVGVMVIPQGAGIKVACDKYFVDFPSTDNAIRVQGNTYVIADIGMGTLDLLYVADGKVTPNQVRGIEKKGAMVICARLAEHIQKAFNRKISLKEAKRILDSGSYELRGNRYDLSEELTVMKKDYLKMIEQLIEQEFGEVLDKSAFVILAGGGAYFFAKTVESDAFYFAPKDKAEYYNSIGFAERAWQILRGQ